MVAPACPNQWLLDVMLLCLTRLMVICPVLTNGYVACPEQWLLALAWPMVALPDLANGCFV
jgi:hypothetical protein